jgi:hypothetical protein
MGFLGEILPLGKTKIKKTTTSSKDFLGEKTRKFTKFQGTQR